MIADIPTSDQFRIAALNNLNLAFDIVIQLKKSVNETFEDEYFKEGKILRDNHDFSKEVQDYWKVAQHPLGNALTLLQQGQELGIKARLVNVSTYICY